MESAYALANRELAQIRETNRAEHNRRLNQVLSASPRYAKIESDLTSCGTALAKCVLDGGKGIYEIEAAIKKLQAEKATILKSLNLPEDYLDDIYSCKKCHDTGFDETGRRCSCLCRLITGYIGSNANLTEYMKEQTFDNFDYSLFASQPSDNGRQPLQHIKHAYQAGMRFAETFDETHSNLLLMGNAGTGKTYLSGCIANYVLARGKTVYYQTAFRLFDILEKLKFGRCTEDEQDQFEAISNYVFKTDLLIIDDLGTEFVSAYSAAALFDIVNTRQLEVKSTILSTNLNSETLTQLYSRRLTSRLWGSFEIIQFIGQDLRLQKHRKREEHQK